MRIKRQLRDQYIQHEMRTHGRKNGYVTQGQIDRLEYWLPIIGLPKGKTLAEHQFTSHGPLVMEIGFGNGEFLEWQALQHPDWRLLGAEIYLPGVAKAVSRLDQAAVMGQICITQLPAQYVLQHQIAAEQLDGMVINHPDPWPKKRHHSRRIIQKDSAALIASRLKKGGFLKLASDKPDLAEWMRDILDASDELENVMGKGCFAEREQGRIETKFEQRGHQEGRVSQFLHYVKV